MNEKKIIEPRKVKASDFILTWTVTAAAIAVPLTDGGWFNLANYTVLFYGWMFGVLLFIAMLSGPLEKLPVAKPWHHALTDIPRFFAIGFLIYSEYYWHGSLLVCCWLFASAVHGNTKRAYEEQQASG